jgi:leishmanolysin-like peptidase
MSRYGSTERSLTCADGKEETMKVPNIIFEEKDTEGYVSYEIRSPRVTEIVRNHFDCMILTGAKLEQGKGSIGCFGGFLDDHVFYSEELTGFEATSSKGPSISPLTLALLEDSSWYTANYKVSAETSFGRGAGCQFARSGCLFDEASSEINSDASIFHCLEIGEMGCDASHSHKARCDFLDSVGSSFCPMHAREPISCTDSSAFLATQGEFFGDSSKCFHTSKGEPMCLRGECNTLTSTIDVYYDDKKLTCQKDDQIIEVDPNTGLQIKCPKIAVVCPSLSCPSNCSGRGVCDRDKDGKHSCICDDPFDTSPGCYGDYNADEL